MPAKNLDLSLSKLKGASLQVSDSGAYAEPGAAPAQLPFSDGSRLRTDYWRVIKSGKAGVSSFDHLQRYGLPAPIDAIVDLQKEVKDVSVIDACLNEKSGDLLFHFSGDLHLQVLNFTSYEVWEIHFPDGTGEYSPHAGKECLMSELPVTRS